MLLRHTPLWQSELVPQLIPDAQGVQEPPQSTSLSLPFFAPSSHAAAVHTLLTHSVLWQSAFSTQARPAAHGEQLPPQSTSVSFWFITPSLQRAGWQKPLEQTPVKQSSPLLQM
jgi:hypothetical protein